MLRGDARAGDESASGPSLHLDDSFRPAVEEIIVKKAGLDMQILSVTIDALLRKEVLAHAVRFLEEPGFHRIATVNPEFLVLAEKNEVFRQTLAQADLRVVDGFGIVLAGFFRGEKVERYPGVDLMEEILSIANERQLSVFFVVRQDGFSSFEEVRVSTLKKYPNIIVDGTDMDVYQVYEIHNTKYDILLCNFGAPEQEFFLESLRNHPGSVRLVMGVGGALDFLTGKQKRAPRWMRVVGLEWLWRLALQPQRLGRIWQATGVFLWRVLQEKRKTVP